MSLTSSEALPAPYKNRRGWLIFFGVVEILIGLVAVIFATLMWLLRVLPQTSQAVRAAQPPAAIFVASFIYVLVAAFFLVAGTGSIQCKNWARVMMLIGSACWMVMGLFTVAVVLFIVPRIMASQGRLPPGARGMVIIVMTVMVALLGVLLPLVFLVFYTRKSVKATCLAHAKAEAAEAAAAGAPVAVPARAFPLPLIVLIVWEALGVLGSFSMMRLSGTVVFGVALRGGAVVGLVLTSAALGGLAAWLMYQRKLLGWQIALVKVLFWLTSSLVTMATRNVDEIYAQLLVKPDQQQLLKLFPHFAVYSFVGGLVLAAGFLALLFYCRKFFSPPYVPGPVES